MPIYEYECEKCGNQFEFLLVPTSPKAACPKCKSSKLKQLISLVTVSSDATKAQALKSAKRRNKKLGEEKGRADHEYYHKHAHDH